MPQASREISVSRQVPSESLQKTITGGMLELLPASPLLETPASKCEELLAGQEATTWPPTEKHASAEISAQPTSCLQGTKLPGVLPPSSLEDDLPLGVLPPPSSDEQERVNTIAATAAANRKPLVLLINNLIC